MPDVEKKTRAVIDEYVARRLVFFIPGEPREQPGWVSSGTIFSTSKGHVVILTARHCAKDAESHEIRLGFHRCVQVLHDAVGGVLYHPDPGVDVGVMVLRRHAREALPAFALGLVDIAEDDVDPTTDALFLGGFPAKWVINRGPRDWGMVSANYGTALAEPPRDAEGRYRVLWTQRETPTGNVDMPEPDGISGGALWRFRGGVSTVWSPSNRIRITGIPVAWRPAEHVEVSEPSSRWRAWVVRAFDEIDRAVPIE